MGQSLPDLETHRDTLEGGGQPGHPSSASDLCNHFRAHGLFVALVTGGSGCFIGLNPSPDSQNSN